MRPLIGLSLLLTAIPAATTDLQAQVAPEPAQIRASGTAHRALRPELATLTLSFTGTGRSPASAGRAVAMRADSLRRAFVALGIPRDSLISGSRWYWWRGRIEVQTAQRQVVHPATAPSYNQTYSVVTDTTYRASDQIDVHIRDLTRVGAVIDSALAHGVIEITPVRFTATPSPELQEALTREATADAMRQAATLAEASHVRLGRLLSLSTQPEPRYSSDSWAYSLQSGLQPTEVTSAGGDGSTTVVQPSITVNVTVYARWEILP